MPCRPGFTRINTHFKIDDVCKPGNTLLWDLLQDDKIVKFHYSFISRFTQISI